MFSFSSLASSLKKGHLSAFEIWWPALVKRQNIYHKRLEVFQCYQPLAIKILVISTNPTTDMYITIDLLVTLSIVSYSMCTSAHLL